MTVNIESIYNIISSDNRYTIKSHPAVPNPRITRNDRVIAEIAKTGIINEPLVLADSPDGDGPVLVDGFSRLTGFLEYLDANPTHPKTVPCRKIPWHLATGAAVTLNLAENNKTPLNTLELANAVRVLEGIGYADEQIEEILHTAKLSGSKRLRVLRKFMEHTGILEAYSNHDIELPTANLLVKKPSEEHDPLLERIAVMKADGTAESDIRKTLLGKKANARTAGVPTVLAMIAEEDLPVILDQLNQLNGSAIGDDYKYAEARFMRSCEILGVDTSSVVGGIRDVIRLASEIGKLDVILDSSDYSLNEIMDICAEGEINV